MNETSNAAVVNADTNGGVASDVVITLDDLLPMWGEGDTRADAINDLAIALGELATDLDESRGNMAPHLEEQLRFLELLAWDLYENRGIGKR